MLTLKICVRIICIFLLTAFIQGILDYYGDRILWNYNLVGRNNYYVYHLDFIYKIRNSLFFILLGSALFFYIALIWNIKNVIKLLLLSFLIFSAEIVFISGGSTWGSPLTIDALIIKSLLTILIPAIILPMLYKIFVTKLISLKKR